MIEKNVDLKRLECELFEWGKFSPDVHHYPRMKPCNIGRLIRTPQRSSVMISEDRYYQIDSSISKIKKMGYSEVYFCGKQYFSKKQSYIQIERKVKGKINRNKVSAYVDQFVRLVHFDLYQSGVS